MDDLTVFCPFSRPWAVERFFAALGASDVPRGRLIAYVDSADGALASAVTTRARALGFDVEAHLTGRDPVPDARYDERRARHVLLRQESQSMVGDGPLLLLEDDTLLPPHTVAPLAATHGEWAVGVQVGRWGRRPVGAWRVVDGCATSLMPGETDVDASGFYCVLTSGAVYKRLVFDRQPLDVLSTWALDASKTIAWSVTCGHLTERGVITVDEAERYSMQVIR